MTHDVVEIFLVVASEYRRYSHTFRSAGERSVRVFLLDVSVQVFHQQSVAQGLIVTRYFGGPMVGHVLEITCGLFPSHGWDGLVGGIDCEGHCIL